MYAFPLRYALHLSSCCVTLYASLKQALQRSHHLIPICHTPRLVLMPSKSAACLHVGLAVSRLHCS